MLLEAEYSPLDHLADPTGEHFVRAQRVYAALLGCLCVLHYAWFWMMLQKSYREVAGGGKEGGTEGELQRRTKKD